MINDILQLRWLRTLKPYPIFNIWPWGKEKIRYDVQYKIQYREKTTNDWSDWTDLPIHPTSLEK
jgi:hypothetical protein